MADPAFGEAIRAATNAAQATQSAQTPEQWTSVATSWQQAIDLLNGLPASDANHETAQTKAGEYKSNLDYAIENVSRARQVQVTLGHQIFKQNNSFFQVRGLATDTPIATTLFNKSTWDQLSHEQKVALAVYTKSLISEVKKSPEKYVDIDSNAPIYPRFIQSAANLCSDCWAIILGEPDETGSISVDTTILQGDTPWNSSDPCCQGTKASDFADFDLKPNP